MSKQYPPCPVQPASCSTCYNLLVNPGFEEGLTGWQSNGVIAIGEKPFVGTQMAKMGPGIAYISQDVSIIKAGYSPLFLSFNVFAGADAFYNGNLLVEVLWLDFNHNPIGIGLDLFIPDGRVDPQSSRLTYYGITDRPPPGTFWARLLITKGREANLDIIEIDQIILAPINNINLIQNPSFESGLTNWVANLFSPSFDYTFEGNANAQASGKGQLYQNISIADLPAQSSFLLSFAVFSNNNTSLSAKVYWLDAIGNIIGTGLDLIIPGATLGQQSNYLSYLDVTSPAPANAVNARVVFDVNPAANVGVFYLDQIIFAKIYTQNLIDNPSFENGLTSWEFTDIALLTNDQVYEGKRDVEFPENGGFVFQDVPIDNAKEHCFLLNFGLRFRLVNDPAFSGRLLAKVIWLNAEDKEIGLGLSMLIPGFTPKRDQWLVYTGVTEKAPRAAVKARIQFTKSSSIRVIELDKIVFASLI